MEPDTGVVRLLISDGKINEGVRTDLSMTREQVDQMLKAKGLSVESTYYCSVDGQGNLVELIEREAIQ